MFEIVILAVVMSVDALFFGTAMGVSQIRCGIKAMAVMCATGIIMIISAMTIGEVIYSVVPYGKAIGGLVLIGTGIYISQDKKGGEGIRELMKEPKKADINKDNKISVYEAIVIGMVLYTDSFCLLIGAWYMGLLLPMLIVVIQAIFMGTGLKIGKKITHYIKGEYMSLITGVILIVLGFIQLSQ